MDEKEIQEMIERRKEAVRLLGKGSIGIRRELREEIKNHLMKTMMTNALRSRKNKFNVTIATNRLKHYANTSAIATEITRGLFPNDEDLALGAGIVALYHDIGQPPFGHDGEEALINASIEFNSGSRLHNIDGAMKILYRLKPKIKIGIAKGIIIKEEVNRRRAMEESEDKRREITYESIARSYDNGNEPELEEKVSKWITENEDLAEEAVWTIATGAGNHNGERGSAHIVPRFDITNEEFLDRAKTTYYYKNRDKYREADKQMEPCSIIDAIVKMADQISSMPLDIIDAKRAGVEAEIAEEWAYPISHILGITIDDAKSRLKGDDQELRRNLVTPIQEKMIESVIRCSSPSEIKIDMDLAKQMYGITDDRGQYIYMGLRQLNQLEHQHYTSTEDIEDIVKDMISDLVLYLTNAILDENHAFPEDLNTLFREPDGSRLRKSIKRKLQTENGIGEDKPYRDFYMYLTELSRAEYKMNRKVIRYREIDYLREDIEDVLARIERNDTYSRSSRSSRKYLIEEYVFSPEYEAMEKDKNGKYSDEQIGYMIRRINAFLRFNPIEGRIRRLSFSSPKMHTVLNKKRGRTLQEYYQFDTDQQIAARIAVSYIQGLNELDVVELASKLGILSNEERKILETSYDKLKLKEKGLSYVTQSNKGTGDDYRESAINKGKEPDAGTEPGE